MKQATLIILVILLVLAGGTVYLNKQLQKQPASVGQMKNTSESVAQPELSLTPKNSQAKVGDKVIYTVRINPGNQQVVGVETYFMYDTASLSNVTVTPSTFFSQPEELMSIVDINQGKISYALGTFTPQKGEGELFTISATVIGIPTQGKEVLQFDRNSTKVALFGADGQTRIDESQTQIQYHEVPLSILSL